MWISEQTAIISLYSINWLVFITETECVYCAVRTGSLYNNSTLCPHTVFMCCMWIWDQTAIISLYNIIWLVFIMDTESVYCAAGSGSLNITLPQVNFRLSRLVAGLSTCRPGFYPRTVNVIYAMDKVALGKTLIRVIGFPLPVSFHQCPTIIFFSYQKTNEKILGFFQKAMLCRK